MLLYFRSRRYIGGPALAAKSRRRARGAARDAAAGDAQPADSAQTQST
jgi:hypothetical protein